MYMVNTLNDFIPTLHNIFNPLSQKKQQKIETDLKTINTNISTMALSYVDFIAKNVEVCVKYYVNREPRWYRGKVVRVLDRFIDNNLDECIKCIVKYDKDKYTEVFNESDYNTDEENAWCFGDNFVSLVESIKAIVDDIDETDIGEQDHNEVSQSDDTDETEHTSDTTTTDNDGTEESDDGNDNEEVFTDEPKRKRHSLANNLGATLFMLAPWIASGVALYNARKEIFAALSKF